MRKIFVIVLVLFCMSSKAQVGLEEQTAYLDSVLTGLTDINDTDLSLSILDRQLDLKNSVISKLKFQIEQVDKDIYNNELFFQRLNSQLDYEKEIYKSLIITAWRLRDKMYQNFDIFSFDNLYKTYRQFLYIKWLKDYRLKKIKRINALKAEIVATVEKLDSIKAKKNNLAEKLGVEQSFIKRYSTSRNLIAKNFSQNKNGEISREILKNNLDSIGTSALAPIKTESDRLSALFEVQKGYLIWPVHKAVIIKYFGESKHPVYEKVTVRNDGLDFCVPSQAKVRCVYNGTVTKIVILPQNKYSVIVRHGTYFTVYSGLDHIKVSVGDELEKEDAIGGFDTQSKNSVFNFQIWHDSKAQNPYYWLIRNVDKDKK